MAADLIERHYEGLFNEVSAAVFVVMPGTGAIVSANTEAEELTGYDHTELRKVTFWEIFRSEDHSRVMSIVTQSAGHHFDKLYEHNIIIQKRSRRKIFVDLGFRRTVLQGHEVFIFTLQDITDIKMRELEISAAHQTLDDVFQSVQELLIVTEADLLVRTNRAVTALLGITNQELPYPIRNIFLNEAEWQKLTRALDADGVLQNWEMEFKGRTGVVIPVLLSASLLPGNGATKRKVVLTAIDLTKQKERERVIADQNAMLVQASKLADLGEMAAGIAHEINNPLHIISGSCELLEVYLKGKPDDDPVRAEVGQIERMATRVAKIVHGLQALSRDGSGDPLQPVKIDQIITNARALCDQRIAKRGVTLNVRGSDQGLWVNGRHSMLIQVLLNLVNNALDAVDQVKGAWIEIAITAEHGTVMIAVKNNGPRIPDSIREKVFQPFFTTKSVGKGTGLGLSIAQNIMTGHGGTLELQGEGVETCFVMRLPKMTSAKTA